MLSQNIPKDQPVFDYNVPLKAFKTIGERRNNNSKLFLLPNRKRKKS